MPEGCPRPGSAGHAEGGGVLRLSVPGKGRRMRVPPRLLIRWRVEHSADFRSCSSRFASAGKEYAGLRQRKNLGLDGGEQEHLRQVLKDLDVTRRAFSDSLAKMIAGYSTSATGSRNSAMREALPDVPEKWKGSLRNWVRRGGHSLPHDRQ